MAKPRLLDKKLLTFLEDKGWVSFSRIKKELPCSQWGMNILNSLTAQGKLEYKEEAGAHWYRIKVVGGVG